MFFPRLRVHTTLGTQVQEWSFKGLQTCAGQMGAEPLAWWLVTRYLHLWDDPVRYPTIGVSSCGHSLSLGGNVVMSTWPAAMMLQMTYYRKHKVTLAELGLWAWSLDTFTKKYNLSTTKKYLVLFIERFMNFLQTLLEIFTPDKSQFAMAILEGVFLLPWNTNIYRLSARENFRINTAPSVKFVSLAAETKNQHFSKKHPSL